MTVGELLDRASGRELAEWQAFYLLEPFGEERDDMRAAMVAALMTNLLSKRDKPVEPKDFMPLYERKEYGSEELQRLFGPDDDAEDDETVARRQEALRSKILSVFRRFKGA